MSKTHGLIVIDDDNRLVVDSYGNVLLFKTYEDATPYIPVGGKVCRVITAKIPRRRKLAKEGGAA